jgi:hypothetical protein
MERSSPLIATSSDSPPEGADSLKNRDELKHVQDNVELMRNRVQLLRSQLQREKDAISKHKSLTREVVQQKIEYNKLYSIVRPSPPRKRRTTRPSTARSPPSAPATTPTARCTRTK